MKGLLAALRRVVRYDPALDPVAMQTGSQRVAAEAAGGNLVENESSRRESGSQLSEIVTLLMTTSLWGRSLRSVAVVAMESTVSIPEDTWPKMVYE